MASTASTVSSSTFIVVIDDDASVRNAMQNLMKSLGHHVALYASANEFLRSADLTKAQCLILDIQMPGLSGIDLQNIVSALRAPIPIIFVTAHSDEDVRLRALSLGAVGFLEKPFDDEALIELIDKALHQAFSNS